MLSVLLQTNTCELLAECQIEVRRLRVAVADREEKGWAREGVANIIDKLLLDRLPVELHAPRFVQLVEREADHEGLRVAVIRERQFHTH